MENQTFSSEVSIYDYEIKENYRFTSKKNIRQSKLLICEKLFILIK